MPDFSCCQSFLFADFNKDDVRTDLADLVPGNDKFLIRSKQAAEAEWSRNNDGTDASFLLIEDQVVDFSKTFAVTAVDHIFFL